MKKAILVEKLAELRRELASSSALDQNAQEQVQTLIGEIERAVELPEGEQSDQDNFSDDVQDLILKFETEHPQITSALNQVASALANLGI